MEHGTPGAVGETISVSETTDNNGYKTKTRTVSGTNGVISKTVTVTLDNLLIEFRNGEGADVVTTHYDYDTADRRVLMKRTYGGIVSSWERTLYPAPALPFGPAGPITIRPYNDLPLPAVPLDPANDDYYKNQGHVTDASNPADVHEKIQGVEIAATATTRFTDIVSLPGVTLDVTQQVRTMPNNVVSTSISKAYPYEATPLLAGRSYFEQGPDGSTRTYSYEAGDWTQVSALFTPNAAGLAVRTSVIEGVPHGAGTGPMIGVTKKEVSVTDANGFDVFEEEWICNGEGATPTFAFLTNTLHTYYTAGLRISSVKDFGKAGVRTLYSAISTNGFKVSETDATGIVTDYPAANFTPLGSPGTVIRRGVSGGTLPAIPDRTSVRTYDALNRLIAETISAPGSASIARTRDFDTAGRLTSEGLNLAATTYGYTNGELTTTRTRPGGVTEITALYLDGGMKEVVVKDPLGAAISRRSNIKSVEAATALQRLRTETGLDAVPFWTETTTDGFGRTVSEKTPVGGTEVEKAFVYNPDGSLESEGTLGFTAGGSDDLAPLVHQRFYGAGLNNVTGLVTITTRESGEGPRISSATEYYAQEGADWYRIAATNRGTSKEKVSGFVSGEMSKRIDIDPLGNVTTTVALLNRPAKTVTRTVSRTGLNDAITIQRNGLVQSATTPSVATATIIGYDGHGRRITVRDARTGLTTTTSYDADFGQVESVTGPGVAVSNTYYPKTDRRAGRIATRTVNTAITRFDYDDLGRQTHEWGAAAYPLRYDFDGNGRLWKLHTYRDPSPNWNATTWPTGAGDGDVTTWTYYGGTTQLQAKTDAAGKATTYTCWPSGLLKKRTWARLGTNGIFTDYTYNDAGEMKKTDYSDATPDVQITARDADGNPTTILDAAGTHTLTYDLLGQIESESIAGGILGGVSLNPEYTTAGAKGRLKEWNLSGPNGLALQHAYGYETGTGRLKTVSDGASTATYDYLGNSDWLNTTTVAYGGATALTTTRTPDTANRLASIVSTRGTQTIESHAWTYDLVTGQRTRDTLADSKYWQYGYNDRGEVQSGVKKQADDSAQPGYNHGYSYDPIGNRLSTITNGRTAGYVSNSLNQYDQRDVSGAVDVTGEIEGANTQVQVSAAGGPKVWATRTGTAFYAAVPVDNAQSAQYPTVAVRGLKPGGGATDYERVEQGHQFLPKTPEASYYDDDGNLLTQAGAPISGAAT